MNRPFSLLTTLSMLSVVAALVMTTSAQANVIRVPGDYPTIQGAIDAAAYGDTVLVAPGAYAENLNVARRVYLISEEGRDATTIDGKGLGPVVLIHEYSEHVEIAGFRITGGEGGFDHGGGIHVIAVETWVPDLVVRDCLIDHNHSIFNAGGIWAWNAWIEDNIIEYNNTVTGEAAYSAMRVRAVSVQRNIIRHNGEPETGADFLVVMVWGVNDPPGTTIADNVIVDNGFTLFGVEFRNGGRINNNTIARNQCYESVILTVPDPANNLNLRNNIVAHGSSDGIVCNFDQAASWTISCNDVWGSGPAFSDDCAGLLGVDGNFGADPLFCDAANGDYRLTEESPCAPENSPAGCGLIGALPVGCETMGIAQTMAPRPRLRLSVRPNPVLAGAEFVFDSAATPMSLEIYDPQGRLVESLIAGTERLIWRPGMDTASGVYFARLKGSGGRAETVRFIVLR